MQNGKLNSFCWNLSIGGSPNSNGLHQGSPYDLPVLLISSAFSPCCGFLVDILYHNGSLARPDMVLHDRMKDSAILSHGFSGLAQGFHLFIECML